MAQHYSPRLVTDNLVMCLDPSQNKSYPTTDLPVKGGLVMWMDAADDSTFSYSSGTTVSQWRDKSGFNYHMVPKNGGPTRTAILNSRKALAFTTSQTIGNNSIDLSTSANTVFVVSRLTGTTNGRVLTCNLDASGNNWLLGHHGGTSNAYYAEGWVYDSAGASTSFQIYMGDWSGSSTDLANFYINGTAYATNNTAASQGPKYLGLNYYSVQTSTCEAAEIIVFNRVLTTPERRLIHTYLGQKWSILNTDRSIIDLSGFNDNGLLGNGSTSNMPLFDSYNKGAFKFFASNKYIKLGNNTTINQFAGDFTVSLWAMATAENSNYGNLIGDYYTAGVATTNEWQIMMNNSSTALNVYRHGTGYIINNTASGFSANTWINVVLTRVASTVTLYANNTVIGTASNSLVFGSATGSVNIGIDGNNSAEPFSGLISNVLIYNKGLSAAEVAQNYQAQKSRFDNTIVQQGLVLNLDAGNPYSYGGAGTTWYDVSGAVNDFTVVNSPTYSAGEFILNGSTQYFSISTGSGFFISSTNNFYADVGYAWSISIWFKFPVSPTTVRNSTINGGNCSYSMIGNAGGIGGAETLSLFVSGGDSSTSAGGLAPYYCVVGVRGSKTQLSAGSVNTNTWNHVVVTWNGSAGRGYFNGVDKGALNIGANAMQVSGYTVGATAGGASSHVFEGSLSQVFVYNRALSAAEVLQNYNALKGRFGL